MIGIDADAWIMAAAARAAGRVIPNYQVIALSNFAKRAKANSYWTKLYRADFFCGDSVESARYPLKYPAGQQQALIGGGFTDLHRRFGALGSSANSWALLTGLNASTLGWSTSSFMCACHLLYLGAGGPVFGALSAGGGAPYCNLAFTTTLLQFDFFAASVPSVALPAKTTGFYVANRRTAATVNVFKDGAALLGDTGEAVTGTVNSELYVLGRNNNPVSQGNDCRVGSILIGTGFSDADCVQLSADHAICASELRRAG